MRTWLVCFMLLGLILAACGPAATATPTASTGGEVVEEATEEAVETPTEAVAETTEEAAETPTEAAEEATEAVEEVAEEATAEVAETPTEAAEEATEEATAEATAEAMELDATFTSADGSLTFDYPSAWSVNEENGQILLASSETTMESTDAMPAAGEFRAAIFVSDVGADPALGAGAVPVEVVEAVTDMVADTLFGEEAAATDEATEEATSEAAGDATEEPVLGETTFEDVEEMTVGTHDAARMVGTRDDGDVVIWAINLDNDVYAVMIAASAPGELADFEPTLMAIAETLGYTPMTEEATEEAMDEATQEATEEAGG